MQRRKFLKAMLVVPLVPTILHAAEPAKHAMTLSYARTHPVEWAEYYGLCTHHRPEDHDRDRLIHKIREAYKNTKFKTLNFRGKGIIYVPERQWQRRCVP